MAGLNQHGTAIRKKPCARRTWRVEFAFELIQIDDVLTGLFPAGKQGDHISLLPCAFQRY
jgi:hypothetical protein